MNSLFASETTPMKISYHGLRWAGIMNNEGRPWSLLYSAYCVIMVNIFGITSALFFVYGNGKLTDYLQAMSSFFIYVQINGKAVNILNRQAEIRKLFQSLEELRKELFLDENARLYLLQSEKYTKKFISVFTILWFSFPINSLVANFISDWGNNFETAHLVLQMWWPWPMTDLWSYVRGVTFNLVVTLANTCVYASFTVLQISFTLEASAFMKVLQKRMANNGPKDKVVFQQHQAVMLIMQDYNRIFAGQIYLEILVSSIQPCGYGYGFIKVLKNYDPGAFDLIYKTLMCVSAPFLICACGQALSTQMEELHYFSYMSNWYEEKPPIRRDLLQMMTATLRPIELNYRKTNPINFACFAKVAQGIYSYFMLIINSESA